MGMKDGLTRAGSFTDVAISDDLTVADDATITDALQVNGTTGLGNATADTVTIKGNTVASGNATFDWSPSSGTFKTGTGTTTVGGSIVVSGTGGHRVAGDITLASGKDLISGGGAGAIDFSAASGVFKTGTGTTTVGGSLVVSGTGGHRIAGDVTLASGKDLISGGGAGAIDFSSASGTFKTGTGTTTVGGSLVVSGTGGHRIAGDITLASGKDLTSAGGAAILDFSAASGEFKTGTGKTTVGGSLNVTKRTIFSDNVSITGAKTFGTGTARTTIGGSISLMGDATVTTGANITFEGGDSAFDGSASTGIFKTPTGPTTVGGSLIVTGTGGHRIAGNITAAASKAFFEPIAAGTAYPVVAGLKSSTKPYGIAAGNVALTDTSQYQGWGLTFSAAPTVFVTYADATVAGTYAGVSNVGVTGGSLRGNTGSSVNWLAFGQIQA